MNPLPETGIVHDQLYDTAGSSWITWTKTLAKFEIPATSAYSTITVPTAGTAKVTHPNKNPPRG